MRTLIDVEQYHYLQRDVVSSFHARLTKGEKIVRYPRAYIPRFSVMIAPGKSGYPVRRRFQGKEGKLQGQDESTEVPQARGLQRLQRSHLRESPFPDVSPKLHRTSSLASRSQRRSNASDDDVYRERWMRLCSNRQPSMLTPDDPQNPGMQATMTTKLKSEASLKTIGAR